MADEVFAVADAFSPQVLVPQIEKVYTEKSALYRAGVSVDVTDSVQFNLGGKTITRPMFLGGLEAKDLDETGATENETQKPSYDYEEIPVASKILPVKFTGSGLEDALRTPGVYNDIVRNVTRGFVKAVDGLLMSYPKVMGGVPKDFGAAGSELELDLTDEANKSLTWDAIVDGKSVFGDTQDDPMIGIMHSTVAKKLAKTADVKAALQGQVVRDGLVFNLFGVPFAISDNVPKAVDGGTTTYTTYLAKFGGLGYAWKRNFTTNAVYRGNDITQVDFTIRIAVMRNWINGKEPIVRILSQ